MTRTHSSHAGSIADADNDDLVVSGDFRSVALFGQEQTFSGLGFRAEGGIIYRRNSLHKLGSRKQVKNDLCKGLLFLQNRE